MNSINSIVKYNEQLISKISPIQINKTLELPSIIYLHAPRDFDILTNSTLLNSQGHSIPGILSHYNLLDEEFKTNYSKALLLQKEGLTYLRNYIESRIMSIRKITQAGYVNKYDIFDDKYFHSLSGIALLLLQPEKKFLDKMNELKCLKYNDLHEALSKLGKPFNKKFDMFKDFNQLVPNLEMQYNILKVYKDQISIEDKTEILEISLQLEHLQNINLINYILVLYKDQNKERDDLYFELEGQVNYIKERIDPDIKRHFDKKGIIKEDVIDAGFDTEYKNIDYENNHLISVQVASNMHAVIKIPNSESKYVPQSLNVHENKYYDVNKRTNQFLNRPLVEALIQDSLTYYKWTTHRNYLILIDKLVKGLIEARIPYIMNDDYYIFTTNPTAAQLIFIKVGDDGNYLLSDVLSLIIDKDSKVNDAFRNNLNDLFKNIISDNVIQQVESVDPSNTSFLNKDDTLSGVVIMDVNHDHLKGEFIDKPKSLSREFLTKQTKGSREIISINSKSIINLIGFSTPADLSMFKDFILLKDYISILNKSMITLNEGVPFKCLNKDTNRIWNGWIKIYDCMLLTPDGHQNLNSIGEIYGIPKKVLSQDEIENMDLLWAENPIKFIDYAMRDSLIPLVHAQRLAEYNKSLGNPRIPMTGTQLSSQYLKKAWIEKGFPGYQPLKGNNLSEITELFTPKNLELLGPLGDVLSKFVKACKGGRNESFMYGYDEKIKVHDYDLASAYTSAMYLMYAPDYDNIKTISEKEFLDILNSDKAKEEIFNNFWVVTCKVTFPKSVKFPNLPNLIDDENFVYTSIVEGTYTGMEIYLSHKMGATIEVSSASKIAWLKDPKNPHKDVQPFDCLEKIQAERRLYPKKDIRNKLLKLIGNAMYGLTAQGISNRKIFSTQTNSTKRISGTRYSNPIVYSWITAFVRCVIGELLHNTYLLSEKVKMISVTTDGFGCNIKNLEDVLLEAAAEGKIDITFLNKYREARALLTGNENEPALELKTEGEGCISIKTRGQIGIKSDIFAVTGLQRGLKSRLETYDILKDNMLDKENHNKEFTFTESRLRSPKDIFTKGGHVTKQYHEKTYSTQFDNKRLIIDEENTTLLDSSPIEDAAHAKFLRTAKSLDRNKKYTKNTHLVSNSKYSNCLELGVRNFIKFLLADKLNLNYNNNFNSYKELVDYIKLYNNKININERIIIKWKQNSKFQVPRLVPKIKEVQHFIEYIKIKFPNFDEDNFYNNK